MKMNSTPCAVRFDNDGNGAGEVKHLIHFSMLPLYLLSYRACCGYVSEDTREFVLTIDSTECHKCRKFVSATRRANKMKIMKSQQWRKKREEVFSRDWDQCNQCGEIGGKLECDHIVPIRHGGDAWSLDNLQTLCRACHERKSAKDRTAFTKSGRERGLQNIRERQAQHDALVVEPIREFREQYGVGYNKICELLNSKGIPPPGDGLDYKSHRWYPNAVRRICRRHNIA